MCEICKKRSTFKPKDLVVREFRTPEWDFDTNMVVYYEGMQLGKVLDISLKHGTVLVLWGADKDKEIEREWCWPSDFVARIRNGKYETIEELWDDPS